MDVTEEQFVALAEARRCHILRYGLTVVTMILHDSSTVVVVGVDYTSRWVKTGNLWDEVGRTRAPGDW